MKIRNGFVSNSSSSSFIIAITGEGSKPCPSCGRKDPDFLDKVVESQDDDTHISITGKDKVIEEIRSWGEEKEEALAGFIKWGIENGQSSDYLLANLSHDIFGILKDDEGFSPRTSSYKKYMEE